MWPAKSELLTARPFAQQVGLPLPQRKVLEPKVSVHLSLLVPDPPASPESCSCCQGVRGGNLGISKNTACLWRSCFPSAHTEYINVLHMTPVIQIGKDP